MRPLESEDFDEISKLTQVPEMWFYFTSDLSNPEVLGAWIDSAVKDRYAYKRLAFVIIEKNSGWTCNKKLDK